MIQLAEDIEGYEARKVPIDQRLRRLLIEIASNRKIDVAIVDEATAKQFDESETGDDVDIDWEIESTRQYDIEWERPQGRATKYFLLLWNANEEEPAVVAYKFTALPVKR